MSRQTKESFEAYLKYIKQCVGDATKPKEFKGPCAICGDKSDPILKKEKIEHAVPPYLWSGTFWVYECPKCKERYTTSESDKISIATLKPKAK